MNISTVSPVGGAYSGASPVTQLAASASQVKNLQVQDEIALAVIRQLQDQQQQMAQQLVEMMQQNQVDLYA
jgi:hypothetical protein